MKVVIREIDVNGDRGGVGKKNCWKEIIELNWIVKKACYSSFFHFYFCFHYFINNF